MLGQVERYLISRRIARRLHEFRSLFFHPDKALYPVEIEITHTNQQKVMILAPHADDETLGCGGTILRHRHAGHHAVVVCFSDNRNSITDPARASEEKMEIRRLEFNKAMKILDIQQAYYLSLPVLEPSEDLTNRLIEIFFEYQPHVLYVPSIFDNHAEHRSIHRIVEKVLESAGGGFPSIRLYEIWSTLHPNRISDITEFIEQKLEAVDSYQSQLESINYRHHITGLNAYRAMTLPRQSGYAEAFFETSISSYRSLVAEFQG